VNNFWDQEVRGEPADRQPTPPSAPGLDELLAGTLSMAKDAGDLGAAVCMLRNAIRAETGKGAYLTEDECRALLTALRAAEQDAARLRERMEAAEAYIRESPCDPDIYAEQWAAYERWQALKVDP
jgi:hypothetical protein